MFQPTLMKCYLARGEKKFVANGRVMVPCGDIPVLQCTRRYLPEGAQRKKTYEEGRIMGKELVIESDFTYGVSANGNGWVVLNVCELPYDKSQQLVDLISRRVEELQRTAVNAG